jgi:hypothetical protein
MATAGVPQRLLLRTTARSLATATETTSMVTCTDPEAMRRSVEPHDRISSGNIYLMKIAAALSTAASRSIVDPVSMERTGRGQRSGVIGMMRTVVMSAEMNDGMTGDMINIASATVIATIVGKTAEMTDVTTVVMIDDMTDIVKIVSVIVIVIANESESEPMTRILRMSAEPRLCEGWTNFAELATTKIRELRTTTP